MTEITAGVAAARGKRIGLAAALRSASLAWAASAIAMVLVLLAPAMWNGFPIIFPDTGGYLLAPITGTLQFGRSALYGLLLYLGLPLALWPIALAQSVLMAWLVTLALRVCGFGRPWLALAVVTALAVLTSLPWITGELLPDVLFPAAVLALYLVTFHGERLATWERRALGAAIALAIAGHMAALALIVALAAALWLIVRAAQPALPRARFGIAAVAVAAGIVLCPLSDWAITGSLAFTPGGSSFLFARLLESGIVSRYLRARCPDPSFRLCDYNGKIVEDADTWLWDPASPFYKIDEQVRTREERTVILATLVRYPLMHLRTAFAEALDQLQSFRTEVSISDNAPTIEVLAKYAPRLMAQFTAARQQKGAVDEAKLNRLHVPVGALAMIVLLVAVIMRRTLRVRPELNALAVTVLLSLLLNAAICAVFSHSVDRYQSRLVPLAVFAVLLLAIAAVQDAGWPEPVAPPPPA